MRKGWITFGALIFLQASGELSGLGPAPCVLRANYQADASHPSPCWQKAATKEDFGECAREELKQADHELDNVYQEVLARYGRTSEKVSRIKKAQDAWIVFRDAEVDALFPETQRGERGEFFDVCRLIQRAKLTSVRAEQLKVFVEHKEGDVCSQ